MVRRLAPFLILETIAMQATVTAVNGCLVDVCVRRSWREERLDRQHTDLRVGNIVQVERVPNNPYLVRSDTTVRCGCASKGYFHRHREGWLVCDRCKNRIG